MYHRLSFNIDYFGLAGFGKYKRIETNELAKKAHSPTQHLFLGNESTSAQFVYV